MTNDKISGVLADYRSNLTAIRGNNRLSDEGRRAEIKELHERTKEQVSTLRREAQASADARRQELRRKVFGPAGPSYQLPSAADAVSIRDARDRVAAVRTPNALGELMQQAHEEGDKVLLRVAAAHAFDQSHRPGSSQHWAALVGEYVSDHPGDAEAFAELSDLYLAEDKVSESLGSTIETPAELRGAAPRNPMAISGYRDRVGDGFHSTDTFSR